ncbi:MAG: lipopolysaccharide kinase InaA family protein [Methylotenera sp.]
MHGAGVVHRALYAKHIFVKPNNIKSSGDAFEVALIDFEKFRPIYFAPLQAADDLMTLNYRTSGWTNTNRLYFLKQYLAQPSLNSWGKLFCKWVIYRSNQKIKQARLSKNGIQHG